MVRKFIDGEVFSSKEVAELLRIDIESVYRFVRDGKLVGFKIGGSQWRITESDLDEFLINSRVTAKVVK